MAQSTDDRRKLLERYGADESRPLPAVLKCMAGIVALCAVATAPWLLAGSGGAAAPVAGAAQAYPNSMAESKRIFDERRQRYEARAARTDSTQGAALAGGLDAPAPAVFGDAARARSLAR